MNLSIYNPATLSSYNAGSYKNTFLSRASHSIKKQKKSKFSLKTVDRSATLTEMIYKKNNFTIGYDAYEFCSDGISSILQQNEVEQNVIWGSVYNWL